MSENGADNFAGDNMIDTMNQMNIQHASNPSSSKKYATGGFGGPGSQKKKKMKSKKGKSLLTDGAWVAN